jgi:carbon-monoxide dehydrogenase small subunit
MSTGCELDINGRRRRVEVEHTTTLLTVLREQLDLTGAKRGCNQGVCGACTILVDGAPMRACLLLAANCCGNAITTVEALGEDRIGRTLQKAFAQAGAIQCGFCTPGMLISARAVLARDPKPAVDDIRRELSGNLCRCSGYRKIVAAVAHAAAELAP